MRAMRAAYADRGSAAVGSRNDTIETLSRVTTNGHCAEWLQVAPRVRISTTEFGGADDVMPVAGRR